MKPVPDHEENWTKESFDESNSPINDNKTKILYIKDDPPPYSIKEGLEREKSFRSNNKFVIIIVLIILVICIGLISLKFFFMNLKQANQDKNQKAVLPDGPDEIFVQPTKSIDPKTELSSKKSTTSSGSGGGSSSQNSGPSNHTSGASNRDSGNSSTNTKKIEKKTIQDKKSHAIDRNRLNSNRIDEHENVANDSNPSNDQLDADKDHKAPSNCQTDDDNKNNLTITCSSNADKNIQTEPVTLLSNQNPKLKPTCIELIPTWNSLKSLPGIHDHNDSTIYSSCISINGFKVPDRVTDVYFFSKFEPVETVSIEKKDKHSRKLYVIYDIKVLTYKVSQVVKVFGQRQIFSWEFDEKIDQASFRACALLHIRDKLEIPIVNSNQSIDPNFPLSLPDHDQHWQSLLQQFIINRCFQFHDMTLNTTEMFSPTNSAMSFQSSPENKSTTANPLKYSEWIETAKDSPVELTEISLVHSIINDDNAQRPEYSKMPLLTDLEVFGPSDRITPYHLIQKVELINHIAYKVDGLVIAILPFKEPTVYFKGQKVDWIYRPDLKKAVIAKLVPPISIQTVFVSPNGNYTIFFSKGQKTSNTKNFDQIPCQLEKNSWRVDNPSIKTKLILLLSQK